MKYLIILTGLILSSETFAHGMSETDKQQIINASFIDYIELGATHMLSGYDHLLFLLGVIFFLNRFIDIVKFITAFTIGHSITLIFATLYSVQANYYLIDAVIALTVCYKAFENLDGFRKYLNFNPPDLIWMVFGFGLIHGFGLSTRLQQLPINEENLLINITGFNLGVEAGQIIALSIMLVIISTWRSTASFNKFSRVFNIALLMVGSLLFIMQLHNYQHSAYSDDYPINKDEHFHAHEDMKNTQSGLKDYKKRIFLPEQ